MPPARVRFPPWPSWETRFYESAPLAPSLSRDRQEPVRATRHEHGDENTEPREPQDEADAVPVAAGVVAGEPHECRGESSHRDVTVQEEDTVQARDQDEGA